MQARRRTVQQAFQEAHWPAPIAGLNTVAAGGAMSPMDAFLLYNMIPAEYGLRTRLGYREWANGITGAGDNYVRSILPFTGRANSGANNKVFATSSNKIWDVTSSGAASDTGLTFSTTSGRAGHGVCHVATTSASTHFLLYFDEVNGLHVYTEGGAWAAVTLGVGATQISGVDPATLVHGTVFKGRVWAVQKDTGNLWYSDGGSLYGAYTKFSLGTKLKAGGSLRGVWNWTYDGGAGIDDALVALSDGGDVVVYQGTDPDDAATFGLTGVWQVGALPAGRDIATDFGGDLAILTRPGLLPMSKLVLGRSISSDAYETARISNLFNQAMLSKASTYGWSLRLHPEENALMITVPESEGVATTQLVMSNTNKGWSRYRDLPMYCNGSFGGKLYFGDASGSVWINDGSVDDVTLAAPTEYTAIQYAGLTAFQNQGSGRQKQVQLIRPRFMGQSASPTFAVQARYDFNQTELDAVSFAGGSGSSWDSGLWDTALWGGEYSPSSAVRGATGMGSHVAIAWRGAAIDRTILVGFDVSYSAGGWL